MSETSTGPHRSWVELVEPDRTDYVEGVVPLNPLACGEPSPTASMLCDLPASQNRHRFGQHLGIDRNGCFRGWKDTRPLLDDPIGSPGLGRSEEDANRA